MIGLADFQLRNAQARPGRQPFGQRAFTLMEVLLALAVSAIVLAAISGVFYSAVRLRERTLALLDESLPLEQALTTLRRDLLGSLPPGGILAGQFKNGPINNGVVQANGLQFSTTTGLLREAAPWGDIQEVTYHLQEPVGRAAGLGKDLVRSVSRNLLTTTVLDADEQVLLTNVRSLEFACFDGTQWRESWDTNLGDTNLPSAVRLRLLLASDTPVDARFEQPIELIVPLALQSRTNSVQAQ